MWSGKKNQVWQSVSESVFSTRNLVLGGDGSQVFLE